MDVVNTDTVSSPFINGDCVEINDTLSKEICASSLKPLSLNTFDDFEEGNVLSKLLEAGVEHLDDFSLGDSSLKGLGFISPIKVIKESRSGYFLRSSSKVLDSVSSAGFRRSLTSSNQAGSALGNNLFDVFGALREVDARCNVTS